MRLAAGKFGKHCEGVQIMGHWSELVPLLLLLSRFACAEVVYNVAQPEDPCVNSCKGTPLALTNKELDPEVNSVTTSCQRGCRFFNLVDLHRELEPSFNLNSSLSACRSSCNEAYVVLQDLIACRIGCAFMANQRDKRLSLFSIAIHIDDGLPPKILWMTSDAPDNEATDDAGRLYMSELGIPWWDVKSFRLCETYLKTMPIDSGTADYGMSAEYLVDNERSVPLPGSDWLLCASRHTGIPRWLLGFAIAAAALSALWLCLSPDKSNDSIDKITLVNPSTPSKITIYLPDEVDNPMLKKPPPKYCEVVAANDLTLEV